MMKKLIAGMAIMATLMTSAETFGQNSPEGKIHTFEQGEGTFLLDGKPFVVKAAELHYLRIPSEYWEHRIEMCKALGMNAVCVYVFWNAHEMREGEYDFSGDKDLGRFVGLCKKHGMWVILRPGPYTCAEWEMGGLPWWLLKHDDMELRSLDQRFMTAAGRFERRVAKELEPYRLENGGNILMVQVENEFGSYGTDKPYISAMRDSLRAAGWDKTQLFQCDWSSNFEKNALDDLLWTMNFGTGAKVEREFRRVGELRPTAPKMCSEYWSGWFDGWGSKHQTRPAEAMVRGISDMLQRGISFSLYMTHGGTSFGHWAGSNNKGFAPDCTSYDYDAPIDEQGAATAKYHMLRDTLARYASGKLPKIPAQKPIIEIGEFSLDEEAPIFTNLPSAIASRDIHPMEYYDQGYGSIIYSCTLPATHNESLLRMSEMHDYAVVYVDGEMKGRLYRGNGNENTLRLEAMPEGGRLDIYVETMGRINYSRLIHDRKGITERVELVTSEPGVEVTYNLKDWEVRLLPTDYSFGAGMRYAAADGKNRAGYYRGHFKASKTGDTYLDMATWSKGLVWVNGHCLGRYWNVGPQQALYLPGCWLRKGDNEVIVMDIVGPKSRQMRGLPHPIVDELHRENLPTDAVKATQDQKKSDAKRKADAASGVGNDAAPGAK